ncbi:hypothetical protein KKE14_02150 [Patescibacteria group bacterium]|nr:hypothetical protein [Patescibacteria group bacterium]
MKRAAALDWLWHYRKFLLTEIVLFGLLQLLYFTPTLLRWWVVAIILVSVLAAWWISNAVISLSTGLFIAELLWIVLGGVGFLIFSLVGFWPAEIVMVLTLVLSSLLIYWHQQQIDYQRWNLDAMNWLSLIDLFALFVTTAALWLMIQFYSLSVVWLLLGVSVQLILALGLLFWRQGLPVKKFWLYALVLALMGQELIWLTNIWHKSIYFKAFLLTMVYYLFSDFVTHYLRGNLTVKLIFEYVKIAIFLVLVLFIFDLLFVLVSNG